MRFVSDKQPKDYAERLHKIQDRAEVLRAELRDLDKEAAQLKDYLLKVGKGRSFEFNGKLYLKQFTVQRSTRMILDQEAVQKMLKSKTPYKPSEIVKIKVDYVYKEEE